MTMNLAFSHLSTRLGKVPRRHAPTLFALVMSSTISGLMSALLTAVNTGVDADYAGLDGGSADLLRHRLPAGPAARSTSTQAGRARHRVAARRIAGGLSRQLVAFSLRHLDKQHEPKQPMTAESSHADAPTPQASRVDPPIRKPEIAPVMLQDHRLLPTSTTRLVK